jgi:hypothetical protein
LKDEEASEHSRPHLGGLPPRDTLRAVAAILTFGYICTAPFALRAADIFPPTFEPSEHREKSNEASMKNLFLSLLLFAASASAQEIVITNGSGSVTVTLPATFTIKPIVVTPPPCLITSGPAWANSPIANQAGAFRIQFDAVPSIAAMDGVTGLSSGAATDYTSLAVAVRFSTAGVIDARNGAGFAALSAIPYTAGTKYSFVLDVNIPAKTYSASVNGVTFAKDYAFRTEQAAVAMLNSIGALAVTGSNTVCGPIVSVFVPVTHSVVLSWNPSTGATGYNVYRSAVSGSAYAKLNPASLAAQQYTDATVSNASTYFYIVRATDATGKESTNSVEVKAAIP